MCATEIKKVLPKKEKNSKNGKISHYSGGKFFCSLFLLLTTAVACNNNLRELNLNVETRTRFEFEPGQLGC